MNAFSTSSLGATLNSTNLFDIDTCHRVIGDVIRIGQYILGSGFTDTASVREASDIGLAAEPLEPDLVPYECCRASGVLSFWDDPSEDIYTFEDGQPL